MSAIDDMVIIEAYFSFHIHHNHCYVIWDHMSAIDDLGITKAYFSFCIQP